LFCLDDCLLSWLGPTQPGKQLWLQLEHVQVWQNILRINWFFFTRISRDARSTKCKMWINFKICKSVHHRTFQINHQPDATVFQFIILTFIYSSTCFGRSPAHHQELNDCSSSLWFYLHIVVTVVLCLWSGRPARPRTQHGYHHNTKVKPEAATAVIELLMMGGRTPKTCWAVNKRQDNKLENCCIWFVIYLKCKLMFYFCWKTTVERALLCYNVGPNHYRMDNVKTYWLTHNLMECLKMAIYNQNM